MSLDELNPPSEIWSHQASMFEDLLAAVKVDSAKSVTRLLELGGDIQETLPDGRSLLHIAAWENACDVATLLIARGADIEARESMNDHTPLHEAAWNDSLEVAEILIAQGADIEAEGSYGKSQPLNVADFWNSLKVARLLIKVGANTDGVNPGRIVLIEDGLFSRVDTDRQDPNLLKEKNASVVDGYSQCRLCDGTGLRTDEIGINARTNNPDYGCNGCGSSYSASQSLKLPDGSSRLGWVRERNIFDLVDNQQQLEEKMEIPSETLLKFSKFLDDEGIDFE